MKKKDEEKKKQPYCCAPIISRKDKKAGKSGKSEGKFTGSGGKERHDHRGGLLFCGTRERIPSEAEKENKGAYHFSEEKSTFSGNDRGLLRDLYAAFHVHGFQFRADQRVYQGYFRHAKRSGAAVQSKEPTSDRVEQ